MIETLLTLPIGDWRLPIFADAPTPSPFSILTVLNYLVVAGAAVATIVIAFQGRSKKREITPQPLEVSKSPRRYNYEATEGRFIKVESDVKRHDGQIIALEKKLNDELPEMERRLNSAGEDRASETHKRINDILKAVSKLEGKIEASNEK